MDGTSPQPTSVWRLLCDSLFQSVLETGTKGALGGTKFVLETGTKGAPLALRALESGFLKRPVVASQGLLTTGTLTLLGTR